MRIKYFSFAVDIDCQKNFMENSDVILCSLCSVWREERRKKQKKTQNKIVWFLLNGKLRFFMNLYVLLQAHFQMGQYEIAHM